MLIDDAISVRVEEGLLFGFSPRNATRQQRRYIFTAKGFHDAIENPLPEDAERFDDLEADLVSFLVLADIPPNFMFLLTGKQKGVWELKSCYPEPQIRVFGQFAQKDVFIALEFRYRSDMEGPESESWNYLMAKVTQEWNLLFPKNQPLTTRIVDKVFSGAIDGQYFKDQ